VWASELEALWQALEPFSDLVGELLASVDTTSLSGDDRRDQNVL
jgi:hypothetical protein